MAQTAIQRQINRMAGPRRNINGAGVGARLVARRATNRGTIGSPNRTDSQLGSRRQRYGDIRIALGLAAG